jgi:hypothetical protein
MLGKTAKVGALPEQERNRRTLDPAIGLGSSVSSVEGIIIMLPDDPSTRCQARRCGRG